MPNTTALGMLGQQAAERFLLAKGWHILARNFRAKTGEIDLIGRDGAYVVFVEVKMRRQSRFGSPREAVGPPKQRRIKNTALCYIARGQLDGQDFRFDVVEVYGVREPYRVAHIPDAFW